MAPRCRRLFSLLVCTALVLAVLPGRAEEPRPEPVETAEIKADRAAVVKGNTQFAFDMYGKLAAKGGNVCFAPYSVSTALAMTSAGARGATAEQMARTLRFPVSDLRLHRAFASLLQKDTAAEAQGEKYEGAAKPRVLHVANALWGQKSYPFLEEFRTLNKTYYGAGLERLDFTTAPEEARGTINGWVARQTKDRIQDLVPAGILGSNTRLVLTNALYFRGQWFRSFEKSATEKLPFHLTADKKVAVPMMRGTRGAYYLDSDDFKLLDLGYAWGKTSLLVILPKKVDGLAAIEKMLTADTLAGWLAKAKGESVYVTLPRFKITQDFRLNDALEALGMTDAFSRKNCNFSGISGNRELFISAVLHKTFVDVNESGTEAAGATAVIMEKKADDGGERPKPAEFKADRPFLFLIHDRETGSIFFLGRVTDPSSK